MSVLTIPRSELLSRNIVRAKSTSIHYHFSSIWHSMCLGCDKCAVLQVHLILFIGIFSSATHVGYLGPPMTWGTL